MKLIKRGFTLIELLIVITIIGILTAIVTTNLQGARERARDSRRKSDLQALNQSLRLYYTDYQAYPTSTSGQINGCGTGATLCPWNTAFGNSTTTYMGNLPLDPSSSTSSTITYFYYPAPSGNNFLLLAKLENLSDGDIVTSQARCATLYNAGTIAGYDKEQDKDYVVCAE